MAEDPDNLPASLRGASTSTASVDRSMASGAGWMVLARIVDRTIGLVSTIILARLLVPEDFGLVAIATSIIGLLELIGTFGFEVALIQNPTVTRKHYDTAWTLNILLATGIALFLAALADPAASFYDDPRLQPVILWLACGTFVRGFENIGVVSFRKELRFSNDFRLMFLKKLGSFAIAVPLAFALRSYWALVAGMLASRVFEVVLTYWVHTYRPRFSLAARGQLFHFGKWLVVSNALYFAGTRSADFIIGKLSGAPQLGLFKLAYEVSNLPTSDLVAPINRAIYPGYAKKAHDPGLLRRSYLEVIGLVAILAVPAGAGIAATADLLVPLVLGPQWVEAAPIMRVLAFYGVFLALKSNNHYIYLALGKPRLSTALGAIQMILLIPMTVIGSLRGGALGAAIGYLCAQALFTPISVSLLRRVLHLQVKELARVFYRPFIAGAIMFGSVYSLAGAHWPGGDGNAALFVRAGFCVLAGVGVYCGMMYILWLAAGRPDSAERAALRFLASKLPARFSNAVMRGRTAPDGKMRYDPVIPEDQPRSDSCSDEAGHRR